MANKILNLLFLSISTKIINSQHCGVPKIGKSNIVGGSYVQHGQFPWHAAILRNDQSGRPKYICGGTLISNKHILTASHCILEKGTSTPTLPRDLLVVLGSHDLNEIFEAGREIIPVVKIHMHPDWNPNTASYDGDIAVVELNYPVNFNDYIQPICLWKNLNNPLVASGVVIGYGKSEDETKIHENIPKFLNVPIHTQEECFLRNPALTKLSSKRTFCGGDGVGKGVCLGDSGGGLMTQFKNVFYLRGIVSSSLRNSDFSCDVNSYAVFTNVLKFMDWIISLTSGEEIKECGVMSSPSGLIQKGKFSSRTEFPWMASIVDHVVHTSVNSSGALISHKHVLTRAHVVGYFNDDKTKRIAVETSRIKIYLGSLQHVSNENVFNVQKIIIYPNTKLINEVATNDIAIIVLSSLVEFSDFIRPVCLWTFSDDLNLIKNLPIYAVGYGKDKNGILTNIRKHAKVTLMDQNQCEKKHSDVKNFLSVEKYFCVIGTDVGSPCNRDEVLFVKFNGKWFLRGTMLRIFFYPNRSCGVGPEHPFLYHDITQNLEWIQTVIKTSKNNIIFGIVQNPIKKID